MWSRITGYSGDATQEAANESSLEVKEQLDQHQLQIEQLKQIVRNNEMQLKNKEKLLEETNSKFQKFKLQSKAKITQLTKELKDKPPLESVASDDQADESPKVSEASSSRGKVLLLKKQLEENRHKYEQREKEMLSSRHTLESAVQQLQKQLEDQQPQEETKQPHKEVSEMYAQMVYKDSKIMELNNEILSLERQVIDLQEHVKEKDQVLSTRNRAIQLMSEDLSRKGKTAVDNLDETRSEMREMQEKFAEMENLWNLEKKALKEIIRDEKHKFEEELARKEEKLKGMEEGMAQLEGVRFELATRNAQLQSKIVQIQESFQEWKEDQTKAFQEEKSSLQSELDKKKAKMELLEKSLEESNMDVESRILKARAKERTKLKNLQKQNEKSLSELEQKLAEVEEEKGTLLLKILEEHSKLDELESLKKQVDKLRKENEQLLIQKHTELEVGRSSEREHEVLSMTLKQTEDEFTSYKNLVITLEEKMSAYDQHIHMLEINQRELSAEIVSKEQVVSDLQMTLKTVQEDKVTLELKIISFEEQREEDEKAKEELQLEIQKLESKMGERLEETRDQLSNELQTSKSRSEDLEGSLRDEICAKDQECRALQERLLELQKEATESLNESERFQQGLREKQDEESRVLQERLLETERLAQERLDQTKASLEESLKMRELQLEEQLLSSSKRLAQSELSLKELERLNQDLQSSLERNSKENQEQFQKMESRIKSLEDEKWILLNDKSQSEENFVNIKTSLESLSQEKADYFGQLRFISSFLRDTLTGDAQIESKIGDYLTELQVEQPEMSEPELVCHNDPATADVLNEISLIRNRLQKKNLNFQCLKLHKDSLIQKMNQMENESQMLSESNKQLVSQLRDLNFKLDSTIEKQGSSQGEVERLTLELRKVSNELEAAKTKIESSNDELKTLQNERNNLQNEMENLILDKSGLKARISTLEGSIRDFQGEISMELSSQHELRLHSKQLEDELEETRSKLDISNKQKEKFKESAAILEDEYQTSLKNLELKDAELKRLLNEMDIERESNKVSTGNLQNELDRLRILENEYLLLGQDFELKEDETRKLLDELETTKTTLQNLENEVDRLSRDGSEYQLKDVKTKKLLDERETEFETTKTMLATLQDEVQRLRIMESEYQAFRLEFELKEVETKKLLDELETTKTWLGQLQDENDRSSSVEGEYRLKDAETKRLLDEKEMEQEMTKTLLGNLQDEVHRLRIVDSDYQTCLKDLELKGEELKSLILRNESSDQLIESVRQQSETLEREVDRLKIFEMECQKYAGAQKEHELQLLKHQALLEEQKTQFQLRIRECAEIIGNLEHRLSDTNEESISLRQKLSSIESNLANAMTLNASLETEKKRSSEELEKFRELKEALSEGMTRSADQSKAIENQLREELAELQANLETSWSSCSQEKTAISTQLLEAQSKLEEVYTQREVERKEMDKEMDCLQKRLGQSEQGLLETSAHLRDSQKTIDSMSQEIAGLKASEAQLTDQLQCLRIELEKVEVDKRGLENERANLITQLEQGQHNLEEIKSELRKISSERQEDIKSLRFQLEDSICQVHNTWLQTEVYQKDLKSGAMEDVQRMCEQSNEARTEILSLGEDLSRAQSEAARVFQQLTSLGETVAVNEQVQKELIILKEAELEKLHSECLQVQSVNTQLDKEMKLKLVEFEETNRSLEAELDSSKEGAKFLTNELDLVNEKNVQLEKISKELEERMSGLSFSFQQNLNSEMEKKDQELSGLRASLEDGLVSLDLRERELTELRTSCQKSSALLDLRDQELSNLGASLHLATQELSEMRSSLTDTEATISHKELCDLRSSLSAMESNGQELLELRLRLSAAEAALHYRDQQILDNRETKENLEQSIIHKEQVVSELTIRVSEAENDLSQVKEILSLKEEALESSLNSKELQQKMISTLELELSSSLNDKVQLEDTILTLREDLEQLQKEYEIVSGDLATAVKARDEYQFKFKQQPLDQSVDRAEFETLKIENDSLVKERNTNKTKMGKMLLKLKQLKEKNDKLTEQIRGQESEDKLSSELELMKIAREEETNKFCKEKLLLSSELESLRVSLVGQKSDWTMMNEDLKSQLELEREKFTTLESDFVALRFELESVEPHMESLRRETAMLKEQSEMLSSDNETFQNVVEDLKTTKKKLEEELLKQKNALGKTIKDKENELQRVRDDLERALVSLGDNESRISSSLEERSMLEAKLDAALLESGRMVSLLGQMEKQNDRLRETNEGLVKQLAARLTDSDQESRLSGELEMLRIDNQRLLHEFKSYQVQQAVLVQSANKPEKDLVELNSSLNERNESLGEELKGVRESLESTVRQQNERIKEATEQQRQLLKELQISRSEVEGQCRIAQKYSLENQSMVRRMEALEDELRQLASKREELEGKCQRLDSDWRRALDRCRHLEEQGGDLQRLQMELQQAMLTIHQQGLRSQELNLEISKLIEERDQAQLVQRTSSRREFETPDRFVTINMDTEVNPQSLELTSGHSIQQQNLQEQVLELKQQLLETELARRQLDESREALEVNIVREQDRRRLLEEELSYAQEQFTNDITSPSKDQYRLLLEEEPLMIPETDFSICEARRVKTHASRARSWLLGRKNYLSRTLRRKSRTQLAFLMYLVLLHICLFVCIF